MTKHECTTCKFKDLNGYTEPCDNCVILWGTMEYSDHWQPAKLVESAELTALRAENERLTQELAAKTKELDETRAMRAGVVATARSWGKWTEVSENMTTWKRLMDNIRKRKTHLYKRWPLR